MQAKPYLKEISLKEEINPAWDEYPFNIPAIRNLKTLQFHPDVTFLVGENGTGKSTLIESIALAMGFSSEGGTRNFNLVTADTISTLYKDIKTVRSFAKPRDYYFLRAESFYNVATYMDQIAGIDAGYGDRLLHERSHGEAFMATLTMKLRGKGLYIFDEPEAALSPTRQMAALSAIHRLVTKESQFIIATHSPILLAYPSAKIYLLDDAGISEIAYEESDHYVITKNFLNNHSKLLRIILSDDEDS
jgi:predicted ATPase